MAWFKNKLKRRTKGLVSDVVAAYVERSQLASQLSSITPPVTDIEMAVHWALGSIVIAKESQAENAPDEIGDSLRSVTQKFFQSFCQGYITVICASKLQLDPESSIIRDNMTPMLDGMPPERLARTGKISGALVSNATSLAGATIAVLSAGLTQQQVNAAAQFANSLVAKELTLSRSQQEEVREWLTNAWRRFS